MALFLRGLEGPLDRAGQRTWRGGERGQSCLTEQVGHRDVADGGPMRSAQGPANEGSVLGPPASVYTAPGPWVGAAPHPPDALAAEAPTPYPPRAQRPPALLSGWDPGLLVTLLQVLVLALA